MIKPEGWWLSRSSEDDTVYLRWDAAGPEQTVRLGAFEEVAAQLAEFLAQEDFAERPPG